MMMMMMEQERVTCVSTARDNIKPSVPPSIATEIFQCTLKGSPGFAAELLLLLQHTVISTVSSAEVKKEKTE